MVCPTKLQFRTAFGAHLAALASIHCRVTMKSASPCLSPPATKYFLSYFHSRVFLTKQFFSSSWNSVLTIPITFFPACILFQNLPHLYSWLLWTSFSSLFQGKLVYTFLPESSVWASHPLRGCFAVFVKILCPLLPWFRWKFPSHAPLMISSCLNAILSCFQFVSVFSLLSFLSLTKLQLFPSQYNHASVFPSTNCICTLSFMCLYVFSFLFLLFIYVQLKVQFRTLKVYFSSYILTFLSLLLHQRYATEVTKTFSLRNGQDCYSGLILLDTYQLSNISNLSHDVSRSWAMVPINTCKLSCLLSYHASNLL